MSDQSVPPPNEATGSTPENPPTAPEQQPAPAAPDRGHLVTFERTDFSGYTQSVSGVVLGHDDAGTVAYVAVLPDAQAVPLDELS